ncbi:MAG TPA: RidA family protein [Steroidobacteraceae bacterium]|nr:RidA family protein [Steroidobacteraceae bacterium]
MNHQVLQPPGWTKPRGYANGIAASGRLVFIAGQIGWDAECRFTSDRLADQVRQALRNVVAVLAEAGGKPQHLVRLTWYVTSRDEYLAQIRAVGTAYRAVLDRHFPVMSIVQVVALVEPLAKVEIEGTAVLPAAAA